jgi:hypothetical protein
MRHSANAGQISFIFVSAFDQPGFQSGETTAAREEIEADSRNYFK